MRRNQLGQVLTAAGKILLLCASGIGVSGAAGIATAQENYSDEHVQLLESVTYPLEFENDELAGEGAEFLFSEASKKQFVIFGEGHRNAYQPLVVLDVFRQLGDRAGFEYVALEQDPVMMERLSRKDVRKNVDLVYDIARRYPYGITFNNDADLELIRGVIDKSSGKGDPVWGCERAYGVTHVLERLIRDAPSRNARSLIEKEIAFAKIREKSRDNSKPTYMFSQEADDRLTPVLNLFEEEEFHESDSAYSVLKITLDTARYYRNGASGAEKGYFASNELRESFMAQHCLSKFRQAAKADGAAPKVVMKFGVYHSMKGLNPAKVHSVGDFMSALAEVEGSGALSVVMASWFGDFDEFVDSNDLYGFLRAFAPARPENGWAIVDLRPLREYSRRRLLLKAFGDKPDPRKVYDLDRILYGYDLLMFTGEWETATSEIIAGELGD